VHEHSCHCKTRNPHLEMAGDPVDLHDRYCLPHEFYCVPGVELGLGSPPCCSSESGSISDKKIQKLHSSSIALCKRRVSLLLELFVCEGCAN
jgi:hypothetical protein